MSQKEFVLKIDVTKVIDRAFSPHDIRALAAEELDASDVDWTNSLMDALDAEYDFESMVSEAIEERAKSLKDPAPPAPAVITLKNILKPTPRWGFYGIGNDIARRMWEFAASVGELIDLQLVNTAAGRKVLEARERRAWLYDVGLSTTPTKGQDLQLKLKRESYTGIAAFYKLVSRSDVAKIKAKSFGGLVLRDVLEPIAFWPPPKELYLSIDLSKARVES